MREQYNIVEYDSSDPSRQTYLECLPSPMSDLITGRGTKVTPEEIVDDIRVFDGPPFANSRFGSGV